MVRLTFAGFIMSIYSDVQLYRAFQKFDLFVFIPFFRKIYRAENKLYNNLGIVLPVQKCVSQNGKLFPKYYIANN